MQLFYIFFYLYSSCKNGNDTIYVQKEVEMLDCFYTELLEFLKRVGSRVKRILFQCHYVIAVNDDCTREHRPRDSQMCDEHLQNSYVQGFCEFRKPDELIAQASIILRGCYVQYCLQFNK